jgi:hypothetical protein
MTEKRDEAAQQRAEELLRSVRGRRVWSDEEVMELAYDPSHLTDEQLFDYWEERLDAAALAAVEAHAGACAFCADHLSQVGRLVVRSKPAPALVRLARKVGAAVEELGRLATDAAGRLAASGRLSPELLIAGSGALLDTEVGQTVPLRITLDEEGLRLLLTVRIGTGDCCDLKVTAVAPARVPVAGIRVTLSSPQLPAPLVLESDDWGTFQAPEGTPGGFVHGLPLTGWQLLVRLPDRPEEILVEIPDVREVCRMFVATSRQNPGGEARRDDGA